MNTEKVEAFLKKIRINQYAIIQRYFYFRSFKFFNLILEKKIDLFYNIIFAFIDNWYWLLIINIISVKIFDNSKYFWILLVDNKCYHAKRCAYCAILQNIWSTVFNSLLPFSLCKTFYLKSLPPAFFVALCSSLFLSLSGTIFILAF